MSSKHRPPKANGAKAAVDVVDAAGAKLREMLEMGVGLHRKGNLDAAEAVYRGVLELAPDNADAGHLLGLVLSQKGSVDDGIGLIAKAFERSGGREDIALNLAAVLTSADRHAEAEAFLAPLAKAAPSARLLAALADSLRLQGRLDEAVDMLAEAERMSPADPGILTNLGTLLTSAGRLDEAEARYRKAAELAPKDIKTQTNLGSLLVMRGRMPEARAVLARADGRQFSEQTRRMHALAALHDGAPEEALRLCRDVSLMQRPSSVTLITQGDALMELGRFDEARQSYDKALDLAPDHAEAAGKRAIAILASGDDATGWVAYEARRRADPRIAAALAAASLPEWRGEDVAGKTVAVVCEQGLGDSIYFSRFAATLAARGATVEIVCQPPLMRLLRSVDGVAAVRTVAEGPTNADLMVPSGSLPGLLGARLSRPEGNVPYLRAEDDLIARWNDRLAALPRPRIGLHARLANLVGTESRRSLADADLAPLLDGAPASFIDLSVDGLPPLQGVTALGREIGDFADTAAILHTLDLVITVDTALAHLAGAMGRPVWLLLRRPAEWRWGQEGDTCPWYPSMRLFRQQTAGDWSGPVAAIRRALDDFRPATA